MSGFLIENLLKDDDCHRRHKKIVGARDWLIETQEPLEYRSRSPVDETPSPVRDISYRFQHHHHHVYAAEDYVTLLRKHHHEEHRMVRGAKISTLCERDLSCQCEVCVCMICYEVYSDWKQRSSPPSVKSLPTSTSPTRYHQKGSLLPLAVHSKHFSRGKSFISFFFPIESLRLHT